MKREKFTCMPQSVWEMPLSMEERYMYMYLLYCENKFNKEETWFGLTNSDFKDVGFGTNESVLRKVRQGLIDRGMIEYRPGHAGIKSQYLIKR